LLLLALHLLMTLHETLRRGGRHARLVELIPDARQLVPELARLAFPPLGSLVRLFRLGRLVGERVLCVSQKEPAPVQLLLGPRELVLQLGAVAARLGILFIGAPERFGILGRLERRERRDELGLDLAANILLRALRRLRLDEVGGERVHHRLGGGRLGGRSHRARSKVVWRNLLDLFDFFPPLAV
jgi:hypothetical protein